MNRKGRYIGHTPIITLNEASGIWYNDDIYEYQRASIWPRNYQALPVADPLNWYIADTGVLDSSGFPITVDNTAVATWQDQGSAGNHLTAPTVSQRPPWRSAPNGVNNRPAIQFTSTGAYAFDSNLRSSSGIGTENLTVFQVIKINPATSTAGAYTFVSTTGGRYGNFTFNYYGSIINGGQYRVYLNWATYAGTTNCYVLNFDNTSGSSITSNVYINSDLLSGGTYAGTYSISSYTFDINGLNTSSLMCEMIVYGRVLSENERTQVIAYLQNGWNF